MAGLAQALKLVTLHAQHWEWANATFGRKWAREGENPAHGFDKRFAVEAALGDAGTARAKMADANHFLYLVKANQLFVAGGGVGDRTEGLKRIIFHPDGVKETIEGLEAGDAPVEHVTLEGTRGHLDGVVSIKQAEKTIAEFLAK